MIGEMDTSTFLTYGQILRWFWKSSENIHGSRPLNLRLVIRLIDQKPWMFFAIFNSRSIGISLNYVRRMQPNRRNVFSKFGIIYFGQKGISRREGNHQSLIRGLRMRAREFFFT